MPNNYTPKIEYGSGPTTIEFPYPPEGFDPEATNIKHVGKVSEAANGADQTSTNYLWDRLKFTFSFLDSADKDALETFYKDHALLGLSFKYFPNKNTGTFFTVTLDKSSRSFMPKGERPDSSTGRFKYKLKMTLKRVL